jgi:hypothetical protein
VLVIAVTTVASVVTPAVVATALMLQKAAIATAAIALANLGDKRRFIISLNLQFAGTRYSIKLKREASSESCNSALSANKKPR